MIERIKALLRADGLCVYDSAEKIDVCKSPYVVVYDHGIEVTPRTKGMFGVHTWEVVCLVPFEDTDGLPVLEKRVRGLMKACDGLTLSASTGTGIEQTLKARAASITYGQQERLA